MKRLAPLICALLLAACASAPPPPGTLVSAAAAARLADSAATGVLTRADLLATLGPTRKVVFDSGFESWLYRVPAKGVSWRELVVLIGPDGVVRKTRLRAPEAAKTH